MRKPLVIANWKMHGSRLSLADLVIDVRRGLVDLVNGPGAIEVVLCPAYVFLPQVAEQLAGSGLVLGAQDVSDSEAGSHTGDIAGEMLKEFGCVYVLVGHSERRVAHNESNEYVARKYHRAIAAGLQPVLCVGETLQQREAGKTLEVVAGQLSAVLKGNATVSSIVVAYEPVWAIGTGKTASAQQAQEVHHFIRQQLGAAGENARILYGGSVNAANAKELFAQPDIDGGLVGGASLEAESFTAICKAVG